MQTRSNVRCFWKVSRSVSEFCEALLGMFACSTVSIDPSPDGPPTVSTPVTVIDAEKRTNLQQKEDRPIGRRILRKHRFGDRIGLSWHGRPASFLKNELVQSTIPVFG